VPSFTSGTLFTAQLTGVTTTAVGLDTATWWSSRDGQLAAFRNFREVFVQADPGNTPNVLVGTKDRQFVPLTPGQGVTLPITSPSIIFVKAASATVTVNLLARE